MMKNKSIIILLLVFAFGCESNTGEVATRTVDITLKFNHFWDGVPLSASDFNQFKFTNENGEVISIERLRYAISQLNVGGETKNYHLINIGENTGSVITVRTISSNVLPLNFTFGFANEFTADNDYINGNYQDLNSVNFNVPAMLGGGYHYMQFDGKYKDNNNQDANFNYHTIRAVDNSDPNNLVFEDTSFLVDLGMLNISRNATIEIKVNIAEWFKNPNKWDLKQLNTMLMPNFEAQKMMSANGKSVFSLGAITQL